MNILVVDDDQVTIDLLREVLEGTGYTVRSARSAEEALRVLGDVDFPIVLSDIRMLRMDGLTLLDKIKNKHPLTTVVLMTAFGSVDTAVEAVKRGAFDYMSKPFNIDELISIIRKAEQHASVLRRAQRSPRPVAPLFAKKTLIGKSRQIVEVYKSIARAAVSESNILIIGESGTGKELVAREIFAKSARGDRSFLAVNCGALTDTLLESELFGHEKGAFTGAHTTKKGLFEEAHEGVLFLDEIGDISPALQIKLLRVLQDGEFKPVGSNRSKTVNVRVVAATHRNLEELVKKEQFREDLFFRLKVIQIKLPPLRDRMEDIGELVQYFLVQQCEKSRKSISHVAPAAMEYLKKYYWPGNIRELEHAIEHAVVMARSSVLFPEDFPSEIVQEYPTEARQAMTPASGGEGETLSSLEEMEKRHIVQVLQSVKFNKSKAAEILGIDRATLYRKALRYQIRIDKLQPTMKAT